MPPSGGYFLLAEQQRIRKAGPTAGRVAKCPGDTLLGRGRIHIPMNAHSMGVGMGILFMVGRYRIASIVFTKYKKKDTLRVPFFFALQRYSKDQCLLISTLHLARTSVHVRVHKIKRCFFEIMVIACR